MDTGVRETLCSKCLHCQVCGHKNNYLTMVKRLEELFYSVPEEDRSNMALQDPACKFNQKKLEVPSFVGQRANLRSPEEVLTGFDMSDVRGLRREEIKMGGL